MIIHEIEKGFLGITLGDGENKAVVVVRFTDKGVEVAIDTSLTTHLSHRLAVL